MSKQINCYHVTFFNDITSFFSFCKLQIISTWVYVYLVIYGHQIQPSEKNYKYNLFCQYNYPGRSHRVMIWYSQ